jgi:hypothetical protein
MHSPGARYVLEKFKRGKLPVKNPGKISDLFQGDPLFTILFLVNDTI